MVFAENLRRLRVEKFLSQGELARRAGLHAVTLTRLEGGTTAPSTRTIRALALVLDVEPRELATPVEVAELRRVLKGAVHSDASRGAGSADGASVPEDDRDRGELPRHLEER